MGFFRVRSQRYDLAFECLSLAGSDKAVSIRSRIHKSVSVHAARRISASLLKANLTRIESPALLLVFKEFVRSRDVLELSLHLLFAGMQIGMKFACQFLEGCFDLFVGRRSVDTQGLVRVLHAPDPIFISFALEAQDIRNDIIGLCGFDAEIWHLFMVGLKKHPQGKGGR